MLFTTETQRRRENQQQFPPHLGGGLGWGCNQNLFDNVNHSPHPSLSRMNNQLKLIYSAGMPKAGTPSEGEGAEILKVFSVPLCLCGEKAFKD